ncbi:MAG: alkane 1-monooxygenase [Deltaproteobacteria bacterium]|nr:alkane 1-monooxygenase [Deltaproteobacteria bacterium]
MRALRFVVALVLPASMLVALWGEGGLTFFPLAFIFVVTPVLDAALGLDTHNPSPEEEKVEVGRIFYDLWLYAFVALQLLLFVVTLEQVLGAERTAFEKLGLTISFGLLAGAGGINVAHELMHRKQRGARGVAELLMTMVSYPHFCVEHVLGHHRHVATPLDPASSRQGEALYPFWLRTLAGSLSSAWRLEGERVANKGVRAWSFADRRLRMPVVLGLGYLALFFAFGPVAVAFFGLQSLVAVLLLETVNYVEHYGLSRRATGERFERVLPRHSWNSAHRLTGLYLFNLPRHADHHYLASRPYPILRHLEDSPQLPAGYATMMLCAFLPPLWFKIMDRRVDAWNAQVSEPADEPLLVAHPRAE